MGWFGYGSYRLTRSRGDNYPRRVQGDNYPAQRDSGHAQDPTNRHRKASLEIHLPAHRVAELSLDSEGGTALWNVVDLWSGY